MWIFLIILLIAILFFIIILVAMTTSFYALKITTKYEYEKKELLIPSILILITWCIMFILWYFVLTALFKQNIIGYLIDSYLLSTPLYTTQLLKLIVPTCLIALFAILLQATVYYTIYIDYRKIKFKICSLFKKTNKINNEKTFKKDENFEQLVPIEKKPKLQFLNAISSSFISFLIILVLLTILLLIGEFIGEKILLKKLG